MIIKCESNFHPFSIDGFSFRIKRINCCSIINEKKIYIFFLILISIESKNGMLGGTKGIVTKRAFGSGFSGCNLHTKR